MRRVPPQGESAGMEPRLCRIESALGRSRPCPEEPCPFWEDDACIVDRLPEDLRETPGLPELLLKLRRRLEDDARTEHQLIPPGLR
jgi:hypothetical protein